MKVPQYRQELYQNNLSQSHAPTSNTRHHHPIRTVPGRDVEEQNFKDKGYETLPDQKTMNYLRDGRSVVEQPSLHTYGTTPVNQSLQHYGILPKERGERCLNQRSADLSLHDSRGPQASFAPVYHLPGRHVPPPQRSYSEEDHKISTRYERASAAVGREVHESSDKGGKSTRIQKAYQAKPKPAPKERILREPSSPKLSWDNPFPTFPTGRKKGTSSGAKNTEPYKESQKETPQSFPKPAKKFDITALTENVQSQEWNPEHVVQEGRGQEHSHDQRLTAQYRTHCDIWEDEASTLHDIKGVNVPMRPSLDHGCSTSVGSYHGSSQACLPVRQVPHRPGTGRSQTISKSESDRVKNPQVLLSGLDISTSNSHGARQNGAGELERYDYIYTSLSQQGSEGNVDSISRCFHYERGYCALCTSTQAATATLSNTTQGTYTDPLDSYHDLPQSFKAVELSRDLEAKHNPTTPPEEDMPNFDALPDEHKAAGRGIAFDQQLHLSPQQTVPNLQLDHPTQYSKSRPDRERSAIAAYHIQDKPQPYARVPEFSPVQNGDSRSWNSGEVSPLPTTKYYTNAWLNDNSHRQKIGEAQVFPSHAQSSGSLAEREASRLAIRSDPLSHLSGPGQGALGKQTASNHSSLMNEKHVMYDHEGSLLVGHASQTGSQPDLSAMIRLKNPDALPQHPTPVRPGLLHSISATSPSIKPTPVRQYHNIPSPVGRPKLSHGPILACGMENIDRSLSVSLEELQLLRQTVQSNPNDYESQLLLAKKMVEAASVLVDESGHADVKTRAKNRERYILDAHKLVKKLISSGYVEAMFYLADCYGKGALGLAPDVKEAFSLYQSAAKGGHAQSAYRVAVCCEVGQEDGGGTKRDPAKAIQWYRRAATLGDTPAMYKMGMIQLKGLLGQPRNSREAILWLKRAAERADEDNPHALHELGLLYETASGNDTIIRDENYAKQLFTQAANLGYKFSQYRLGTAYEYGSMGCPIDPRRSIAWYSKAAVQEEHQSELALSGWYLTGAEGVLQQSDTEAYLWARKAATAGLAKAEYAMGYFTEVGIGAPVNIEDAKRWYRRAASQNLLKARERLEELSKGGAVKQKSRVSRSAMNKQSENDCVLM